MGHRSNEFCIVKIMGCWFNGAFVGRGQKSGVLNNDMAPLSLYMSTTPHEVNLCFFAVVVNTTVSLECAKICQR